MASRANAVTRLPGSIPSTPAPTLVTRPDASIPRGPTPSGKPGQSPSADKTFRKFRPDAATSISTSPGPGRGRAVAWSARESRTPGRSATRRYEGEAAAGVSGEEDDDGDGVLTSLATRRFPSRHATRRSMSPDKSSARSEVHASSRVPAPRSIHTVCRDGSSWATTAAIPQRVECATPFASPSPPAIRASRVTTQRAPPPARSDAERTTSRRLLRAERLGCHDIGRAGILGRSLFERTHVDNPDQTSVVVRLRQRPKSRPAVAHRHQVDRRAFGGQHGRQIARQRPATDEEPPRRHLRLLRPRLGLDPFDVERTTLGGLVRREGLEAQPLDA